MAAGARPASPAIRPGGLDPLRWLWDLLTNVKFALVLVGTATAAGMVGVVLPQVPPPMRSNAAARSAWIEMHRGHFGRFTDAMDRLGLFDVFHSAWFTGLWAVIIVAVTVCTVSRFLPTWRSVHRPARVVGEGYFERARNRASFTHPGGAGEVEALLRKRRYSVERTKEDGGTVYLFAQRFSWSQYGTFLSHLALLMLLIGALLTSFAGFDRTIVIAETTPAAPVFDTPGPNQIFVRMLDAVRTRDKAGNIVDFRSFVEVRRGDQVKTCQASVNDPCPAFGYNIHQAAWFNDLARLRITGPNGQVVYDDVLDFNSETNAVPVIKVTDDSGAVLFNQDLPQMGTDTGDSPGREDDLAESILAFPKSAQDSSIVGYAATWRVVGGQLILTLSGVDLAESKLRPGQSLHAGGYAIEYSGIRTIPAIRLNDMPGAIGDATVVQMPTDGRGDPYLFVTGVDNDNVALVSGKAVTAASGYAYTFGGQVEASGVSVKRDPGDTFIWVAVAMAIVGLAITFYIPRRRVWVKVTEGRTFMAGVAERTTRFSRELRLLGAELGSRDALQPGDLERGDE
jgi:cytochrome c biogenesis protein ResB